VTTRRDRRMERRRSGGVGMVDGSVVEEEDGRDLFILFALVDLPIDDR
jgi:hypothetical protein